MKFGYSPGKSVDEHSGADLPAPQLRDTSRTSLAALIFANLYPLLRRHLPRRVLKASARPALVVRGMAGSAMLRNPKGGAEILRAACFAYSARLVLKASARPGTRRSASCQIAARLA